MNTTNIRKKIIARCSGLAVCAALGTALASHPVGATTITDPANDFIPSFTGAHSPDIDVLSVSARFDGTVFHLGATLAGPIGTLPTSLYVFGFNRGAGTSNFAAIGAPGVVFDAVITLTGAGVTGGRDLVANTAIVLPAGSALIAGNSFQLDVAASLLPSRGLSPQGYGINFWPRDNSQAGNAAVSDFAPNNSTFTAVPEPASLALVMGMGLAWAGTRRRQTG